MQREVYLLISASNLTDADLKDLTYSKVMRLYKMGKLYWYSEMTEEGAARLQVPIVVAWVVFLLTIGGIAAGVGMILSWMMKK